MKTTTSITSNGSDIKGKARMLNSDYDFVLNDVSYAVVENVHRHLKGQAELFKKTAEEAADKGESMRGVVEACDQLARQFRKLAKAFDIQGLINDDLLFSDKSYSQK